MTPGEAQVANQSPADWSRKLPRPLKIPSVMTLHARADVRALLGHVPAERRRVDRWRHVAKCLNEAARGGGIEDAVIALRLVFMLENVPCVPQ